jgi:hypothetical protein
VIQLDRTPTRRGALGARAAIDRRADRLVAMVAVIIALLYLCAAVLAAFLPAAARVGTWLPLHLALAGGASTAIAGMMPFFSAAFATAQPVTAMVRWASVTAVAAGALGVAVGYAGDAVGLAVAGGSAFVAGLVLTAYATIAPLRRGLGPWGGAVTIGYVCALSMVIVGALIGIAYMTAWPPLLQAWAWVRPAHAWLNLVGFVSLVIATTLLHFFPTVVGARIRRARSAILTVAGLAGGSALVALGFVLRSDPLARLGAVLVLAGSLALAAYAWQAWRTRARWSSDAGWHRFAMGGLVSGIAWFELGMAMACGRLVAAGVDPAESTATILIGPLVLGWVGIPPRMPGSASCWDARRPRGWSPPTPASPCWPSVSSRTAETWRATPRVRSSVRGSPSSRLHSGAARPSSWPRWRPVSAAPERPGTSAPDRGGDPRGCP